MDFLEYVEKRFKELPANRWTGESASGKDIVVKEHRAGVDLTRGPWVKFKFTEGGDEKEIQGYKTWSKGDRIKVGGDQEADDDHIDFIPASHIQPGVPDLVVIIKFKGELHGKPFSYRFEGKTNN